MSRRVGLPSSAAFSPPLAGPWTGPPRRIRQHWAGAVPREEYPGNVAQPFPQCGSSEIGREEHMGIGLRHRRYRVSLVLRLGKLDQENPVRASSERVAAPSQEEPRRGEELKLGGKNRQTIAAQHHPV